MYCHRGGDLGGVLNLCDDWNQWARVSRWVAVLGEVAPERLRGLLGGGARVERTAGGGVAVQDGVEAAAVKKEGAALVAVLGDLSRAGSTARIDAGRGEMVLECDPFGF